MPTSATASHRRFPLWALELFCHSLGQLWAKNSQAACALSKPRSLKTFLAMNVALRAFGMPQ